MVAIGPLSIDAYLPSMPTMADVFGVDIVRVNNTLSFYLIGFALGQLFGGPISDQIGRRKIGMTGLVVFLLASVAITVSTTIEQITGFRIIQALGGGFATVICTAMIRDAYEPEEAAKRFPLLMLVVLLAPLVAPVAGAFLLDFGWQAIFIFLGLYSLIVLFAFFTVPETAPAIAGRIRLGNILPQYLDVLRREVDGKRIPLRYVLTMGLVSSVLLVFVTNSSFIFIEYFGVTPKMFSLYFGANIVVMMICTLATAALISKVSPYTLFRIGCAIQLIAILTLGLLLLLVDVPLWLFTLLVSLTIGMAGLVSPSASALYMAHFDKLAGSASSLITVSMFLLGGILGGVSGLFFDGSLTPIVFTMAVAVIIANVVAASISRSDAAL